ncbi:MAG: heme ABC transporter permease [Proteobacteria bacterium]|nr:heme ABC transporter permease [Pseudomonadota bacterium]
MENAAKPALWMRLANPAAFNALADKLLWPLVIACLAAFAYGLYGSFFTSPADYQQGETVRIMYIHVPAAWLALFTYAGMSVSALGTLVFRHPMADVAQKAAAPIGAAFTLICLITGSFWGKPMWGTWWEWDARLTSVLILFLIYLGIIALWRAIDDPLRGARAVAILTLVGAVNLPIIKFSVDWWYTLHQPASVFRMGGPTIHKSMLTPLFVMGLAYLLLYFVLLIIRMKTELMNRRIERLRIAAADHAARAGG